MLTGSPGPKSPRGADTQAVKVCDSTVRKRLREFEATPTSQLTVSQLASLPDDQPFPGVDEGGGAEGVDSGVSRRGQPGGQGGSVPMRTVALDPPAFINNR